MSKLVKLVEENILHFFLFWYIILKQSISSYSVVAE